MTGTRFRRLRFNKRILRKNDLKPAGEGAPLLSPEQAKRFMDRFAQVPYLLRTQSPVHVSVGSRFRCWFHHDFGEWFRADIFEVGGQAYSKHRRRCKRCGHQEVKPAERLWAWTIEKQIRAMQERIEEADIDAQLGDTPSEALRELARFIIEETE